MKEFERLKLPYENRSSAFLISKDDLIGDVFRTQYYHLYKARIKEMSASIFDNAKLIIGLFYKSFTYV